MSLTVAVFFVVMILLGIAVSKPFTNKWIITLVTLVVTTLAGAVDLFIFKQPITLVLSDVSIMTAGIIIYRFYISGWFAMIRQERKEETE